MMATSASKPLAVVTGASSGIGYELARLAAEQGHDLVLAADRDLETAAETLRSLGATIETVEADLATTAGVDQLLSVVGGRPVAVLCANAGHGLGGAFLDQEFDDARHVVDTNITGTLYLLQKVVRTMRDRNAGRVLITGSIAGYLPGSFQAVYNGTKAFIDSFAWALRNELKDSDVTITLLMPGATDTEFFERAGMQDTMVGSSKKDDPGFVARTGWDAMMKGQVDVVSGLKNKLQTAAASVMPAAATAEMHRKMAEPGYNERQRARQQARSDGEGDFAVKALLGLAAGAVGVWALDRADWFMWRRESLDSRWQTIRVRPKHLPPAETLVTTAEERTGRTLSPGSRAAASQAVHYSLGMMPALGYALLRDRLPGQGAARGALFGAGMFLAQDEVLNTVTGLGAKPQDYPWQAHARGLVAHTIYGVATELALNAFQGLAAKLNGGTVHAVH
jgi:short-subunit dehydrogenase